MTMLGMLAMKMTTIMTTKTNFFLLIDILICYWGWYKINPNNPLPIPNTGTTTKKVRLYPDKLLNVHVKGCVILCILLDLINNALDLRGF